MKMILWKWILDYVKKNKNLQEAIVEDWSKGGEIATYHIKDSEVTLQNVNLINSIITGCRLNEVSNSQFTDSEVKFLMPEIENDEVPKGELQG